MRVLIRNRHTGKEKFVPARSAEDILNLPAFSKDWMIVDEKTPPPHEVIQFQSDQKSCKAGTLEEGLPEANEPIEPPEATEIPEIEPPVKDKKPVERPNYELRKKPYREIQKQLEYLREVDLLYLQRDERKTVVKLVTDELKRRES